MINSARNRARQITREQALKIVAKNNYIKEISFCGHLGSPAPLPSGHSTETLEDHVIRAKVPPKLKRNPKREIPGMRKCNKPCPACPLYKRTKTNTDTTIYVEIKFTCEL